MRFRYIQALYDYYPALRHIAVPETDEKALQELVEDILGTDDLVAIYIPKGTAGVYEPGEMRGRVVGAVRLLPMEPGKTTRDYFYKDWDQTMRWPLGWPCKAVYAPDDVSQCPVLQSLVEDLHGQTLFSRTSRNSRMVPLNLTPKYHERLRPFLHNFRRPLNQRTSGRDTGNPHHQVRFTPGSCV